MTRPALADLLHVGARALIPVAGVVFLGWQAGSVVFVYCADVLASLYAVCVLVCGRLFVLEAIDGPAWWGRLWRGVQLALMALMPWIVIALPLAMTMVVVLASVQFDWANGLRSRELWVAAAAQFGGAVTLLLRDYDALMDARDGDLAIKRRFGLVFLRWAIVLLIAWSVLAELPGYGLTVVLACSIATFALELYPNRVLQAFGAADLALPPAGAHAVTPDGRADPPRARARRHARERR